MKKNLILFMAVLGLAACNNAPEVGTPDACTCARELFKDGDKSIYYARCKELRADSTFEREFVLCTAAAQLGRTDTTGLTIGKPSGYTPAKPADGTYSLLNGQEKIKWIGSKANGKQEFGSVKAVSGKVIVSEGVLKGGEIVIDMKSISAETKSGAVNEKLTTHLHGADFFDVNKFPQARFVITSTMAQEGGIYTAVGQLTIKGTTRQANATVGFVGAGENTVVCSGKLTFDRSQFDVRYGSGTFFDNLGDELINNEVEINFTFASARNQ